MSSIKPFKLSILDLAPIAENLTIGQALKHCLALARFAEAQRFHRYWLAEHHNMPGIASAATSVLIGYLAANTHQLHLGAGGIMLPNHAPLVIAEQFGTLEALYPGRIDLGIGRAPGSDPQTLKALRRLTTDPNAETFPSDVRQLISWFDASDTTQFAVRPIPGTGSQIPIWLLGSSLYSAKLAAKLGLPFAFASHFSPDFLAQALAIYREQFQPSQRLAEPYVMMGINIVAADSRATAYHLFTSQQQQFVNLRRGISEPLPAPIANMDKYWSPAEKFGVERALSLSLVGDIDSVAQGLIRLQQTYQIDEFMVNGQIYEPQHRLNSFGIAMAAAQQILT